MNLNDSIAGRWLAPDPPRLRRDLRLGGDITNPQSLNRYAYALNNPATLTDPSGMGPSLGDDWCPPESGQCFTPPGYVPPDSPTAISGSPTGVATGSMIGSMSSDMAAAYANYASNFGWQVTGTLYGHSVNAFFNSFDQYANWRTSLAALPQNQAYAGYMLGCQYAAFACTGGETVTTRYQGFTGNFTIKGDPLDVSSTGGLIPDPSLFSNWEHGGPSWYTWDFLNAGHVTAGVNGYIEGHYDNWNGVLAAPLHFIFDFLPSLLINPKPGVPGPTYICAPVGGCH